MRLLFFSLLLLISACGGGGESNKNSASPTLDLKISNSKSYVGSSVSISWSSVNTNNCSASNAWNGTKNTTGTEEFTFESDGVYKFELSCTGSNKRVNSSETIYVFKYNKILDERTEQTNMSWGGDAVAISIKGDPLGGNIPPSGIYYTRLDFNRYQLSNSLDDNLKISVFQPLAGYFDFSIDGMLVNDVILNNVFIPISERANIFPKDVDYIVSESEKFLPLVHSTEWYTDAVTETLKLDSYYPGYQNTYNDPEFVDTSLIELSFYDDYRLISTSYGDKTQLDDIPTGEVKTYNLFTYGYLFNSISTHEGVRTWGFNNSYAVVGDQDILVAFGNASISFDFNNGTISNTQESKITYTTFQHMPTLREGKKYGDKGDVFYIKDNASLIPDYEFLIDDGIINGNSFSAKIIRQSPAGSSHVGKIFGSFYGPDAKEIGVNIYFDEKNGRNDYSILFSTGVGKN